MKRTTWRAMFVMFWIALFFHAAAYSQSFTLYGDLKVDEKKFSGIPNLSYTLTLISIQGGGLAVGRCTVPPNGRYRFLNVTNGEYELVVETGGNEAARIHLLLLEKGSADIRRDVELEWREDAPGRSAATPRAAVMFEKYARNAENAGAFEKALQAETAKDYSGALALLNSMVASDPKDFEAWTEIGTVLFKQGKLGDAAKAFNQALLLRPAYPLALLNLGKLKLAQKDNAAAVEILTGLVKTQPQIAEAQFCLGEAYLQVKKGSTAVVHLNEALKLDPLGMADAHLRLAALYNAAGYKNRAAAEYEQFLAKKPDHPESEKLQKYIRQNKKLP